MGFFLLFRGRGGAGLVVTLVLVLGSVWRPGLGVRQRLRHIGLVYAQ